MLLLHPQHPSEFFVGKREGREGNWSSDLFVLCYSAGCPLSPLCNDVSSTLQCEGVRSFLRKMFCNSLFVWFVWFCFSSYIKPTAKWISFPNKESILTTHLCRQTYNTLNLYWRSRIENKRPECEMHSAFFMKCLVRWGGGGMVGGVVCCVVTAACK